MVSLNTPVPDMKSVMYIYHTKLGSTFGHNEYAVIVRFSKSSISIGRQSTPYGIFATRISFPLSLLATPLASNEHVCIPKSSSKSSEQLLGKANTTVVGPEQVRLLALGVSNTQETSDVELRVRLLSYNISGMHMILNHSANMSRIIMNNQRRKIK